MREGREREREKRECGERGRENNYHHTHTHRVNHTHLAPPCGGQAGRWTSANQ